MIRYYYWGHPFSNAGGFGLFGGFLTLLFWILAVYLIFFLIFSHSKKDGKEEESEDDKSPIDILKTRYAKGEINKKEFEEIKKDILKD